MNRRVPKIYEQGKAVKLAKADVKIDPEELAQTRGPRLASGSDPEEMRGGPKTNE